MSCPTTSLVAVAKQDALRAGERLLADVTAARATAREVAIKHVMSQWAWTFTKRFPFVRRHTRAEAESAVNWLHWSNRAAYWRYERYEEGRLAETLISAAHLTQDECVWVNLDDAHTLRAWL